MRVVEWAPKMDWDAVQAENTQSKQYSEEKEAAVAKARKKKAKKVSKQRLKNR